MSETTGAGDHRSGGADEPAPPHSPWVSPGSATPADPDAGSHVAPQIPPPGTAAAVPAANPSLPPSESTYPPVSYAQPGHYGQPATPADHAATEGTYTFPSLQPRPLEPFAILSVATSPLAIVGLGFGLGALRRLTSHERRGRKLAVTGIVLSTLFLTVIVLAVITMSLNGTFTRMSETPAPGDFPDTRVVATVNLAAGNCIATLPVTRTVGEVTGVPCTEDHLVQVTDRMVAGSGEYPGDEALFDSATQECAPPGADVHGVEPWYLVPSQANWDKDERNIMCLIRSTSGPITTDYVN